MKKLILFILVALFPVVSFAKEYKVSDINIKVDVDDNYIVLTRDNLDNNADLEKLNLSKENMQSVMDTGNIYLDIIKKDISSEIVVVVPDISLVFNNLIDATDDMLNSLKDEIVKKTGAKVSSVYKNNYNYVVVDYYDDNTKYYIVNYYTVVNSKGYNFQLQKKSEINDEDRNNLKKIVDSVEIEIIKDSKNDNNKSNNSKFNYNNIIYGAIIGAAAGLIAYGVNLLIKKKKSSK